MRLPRSAGVFGSLLIVTSCTAPPPEVQVPSPTAEAFVIETVAVIGDSISVGENACENRGICEEASWAVGEPGSGSVAARLEEASGDQVDRVSIADRGATVASVASDVARIVDAEPDVVLVLIGANDACPPGAAAPTPVGEFGAAFGAMISAIETGAPDAVVVALSIPDIYRVWEVSAGNPTALERWATTDSCGALLGDPSATDAQSEAERLAVRDAVAAYNDVVAETCEDATRCLHDDGRIFATDFTGDDVSTIDYFHPSARGQAAIADVAWSVLMEAGLTR